ncbi:hypothetical protein ABZ532_30710 [Streptomyces sp. NPDC019396]|uniref:hypothetical protein n=1 Tax=Streptomyces sp. NPDC019396 TaxID=3154687 RepID=UPI0033FDCE5B
MTVLLCLAVAAGACSTSGTDGGCGRPPATPAGRSSPDRRPRSVRPPAGPTQRLPAVLPEAALALLFRWTRERRIRPTVRIARPGIPRRFERIRPDQHIMVVGFTGSGKSSAQRVLAAWVLSNSSWSLEAWGGK